LNIFVTRILKLTSLLELYI